MGKQTLNTDPEIIGNVQLSADGQLLCLQLNERLSVRPSTQPSRPLPGFPEQGRLLVHPSLPLLAHLDDKTGEIHLLNSAGRKVAGPFQSGPPPEKVSSLWGFTPNGEALVVMSGRKVDDRTLNDRRVADTILFLDRNLKLQKTVALPNFMKFSDRDLAVNDAGDLAAILWDQSLYARKANGQDCWFSERAYEVALSPKGALLLLRILPTAEGSEDALELWNWK